MFWLVNVIKNYTHIFLVGIYLFTSKLGMLILVLTLILLALTIGAIGFLKKEKEWKR